MRVKTLSIFLAAIFMIACTSFFSSCSDNDNATSLIVNNGIQETSINRLGGSIDIPVVCDGNWKASIEDVQGKLKWVGFTGDSEGTGAGKISLVVDYLNPNKQIQERTANLVLECNGKKEIVKLRQYIGLKDGESAENDAQQPFTDVWYNKGIGSAFNILTGQQTEIVFNVKNLPEYLTQNKTAQDKIQLNLTDTLDQDTAALAVECNLSVKYGTFKLNLKVNYDNKGYQFSRAKTYNAEQSVTFLSGDFKGVTSLASFLKKDDNDVRKKVSAGFYDYYREIVDSYDDYSKGINEDFKDNVEYLYEGFGPVVITGADLGGSIFFSMRYDSLTMEENFGVKGKLQAEVALAGVKIKGGVSADYAKNGKEIWNASQHYISASGGDAQSLQALTKLMTEKEPNLSSIQTAADAWIKSITSTGDQTDNTSVNNIRYQGVWNLFPIKIAREMKNIAREFYKGKKTCIDLEKLGIASK